MSKRQAWYKQLLLVLFNHFWIFATLGGFLDRPRECSFVKLSFFRFYLKKNHAIFSTKLKPGLMVIPLGVDQIVLPRLSKRATAAELALGQATTRLLWGSDTKLTRSSPAPPWQKAPLHLEGVGATGRCHTRTSWGNLLTSCWSCRFGSGPQKSSACGSNTWDSSCMCRKLASASAPDLSCWTWTVTTWRWRWTSRVDSTGRNSSSH